MCHPLIYSIAIVCNSLITNHDNVCIHTLYWCDNRSYIACKHQYNNNIITSIIPVQLPVCTWLYNKQPMFALKIGTVHSHSPHSLCLYPRLPPSCVHLLFPWHLPPSTTTTTQYHTTNTATSCANIRDCHQIPNHSDQSPRYYRSTEDLCTSLLILTFF